MVGGDGGKEFSRRFSVLLVQIDFDARSSAADSRAPVKASFEPIRCRLQYEARIDCAP
jgi:hypothetical protein